MTVDKKIIDSTNDWIKILRERAKVSYHVELGSSSVTDLADTLENLLKSHAALTDACKDIDQIKARLAKLESGVQSQNKPTVVKPQPRAIKEETDDAVA